jgi:dolichol kinase
MAFDLASERDLALQLHAVLFEIDPARLPAERATALRPRLVAVLKTLEQSPRHSSIARNLRDSMPSLGTERSSWLQFKKRLQPVYNELAARLEKQSVRMPSLRPANYWRSLFHLTSSLVAVVCIELLFSSQWLMVIAGLWASSAWSLEFWRRRSETLNRWLMRFFRPVAHAHEAHRVNSATWYATALLLLSLTQSPLLCSTAVVVLGVGDPCAALIGRRFGKTRLSSGRSLEGSAAFFVSSALATWLVMLLFHPSLRLAEVVLLPLTAGISGAVTELYSRKIDDNLSIPVVVASMVALGCAFLSMTLSS